MVKWKVHEVSVYVPRVIELGKVCTHSSFKIWCVKFNYYVYIFAIKGTLQLPEERLYEELNAIEPKELCDLSLGSMAFNSS